MKCPHAVSQTTVRDLDDVLLQKRLKPGRSSKLCCSFWCGREELYLYTSFCWHVKRKMNVRCSSDAASLMETVQRCYGVATNWKMWWALLLPAVWTQEDNHMLLTLCDCSWRGVFIKLIKMTCFLCFVFYRSTHLCVCVFEMERLVFVEGSSSSFRLFIFALERGALCSKTPGFC